MFDLNYLISWRLIKKRERQRETEKDRQTDRQTETERERRRLKHSFSFFVKDLFKSIFFGRQTYRTTHLFSFIFMEQSLYSVRVFIKRDAKWEEPTERTGPHEGDLN